MEKKEFLIELKSVIDSNRDLNFEDQLSNIDDFDSLVQMSIVAWINDKHNIDCKISDINNLNTVEDIYNFIYK